MRQIVLEFLEKTRNSLTTIDRTVLEALLSLVSGDDTVDTTGEQLRREIEQRQGRELSAASYRQRMKRLGDALEAAKAPFRLVSSQGAVSVQPNLETDKDSRTGAFLSGHSGEKSLQAVENAVPPQALPAHPIVVFSYAWLDGAQHGIQDEFFKALVPVLMYPPEPFKHLKKIRLWRDQLHIRKGKPGRPQMDAACREAFFGLLMLSNKYPHSEACMREADFFLTEDGENQPGKACLIVPVNIKLKDAPKRFLQGARIWANMRGKNLLEVWSQGTEAEKHAFVRDVAEEIWEAAIELGICNSSDQAGRPKLPAPHRQIEDLAHGRRYEHGCENKAPLYAKEGS